MKKFLCSYGYDGSFYMVFVENGVASVKKIGKNYNDEARDLDIAKKVVARIADLKYIFDHTFQYQGKTFNLYYNLFNERIYISRYENSKEVPCDYDEYKKLYDSFVTKVVCLRSDRNGPPRGWNKPQSRYNGSSGFGAYSNGPSMAYTPYKPKKGFRNIKVLIGGVIVTAMVMCSTALLTNCRGATIRYPVEEALTSNPEKYIDEIRSQLEEEGTEDWAIDSVVEQFCRENDLQSEGEASAGDEEPATKKSERLMESIRDNHNLSDEDKQFYEKNFTRFFNWSSTYMDDVNAVANRLETLKVEYKEREEIVKDWETLNKKDEGSEEDGGYSIGGFYVTGENRIEIANDGDTNSLNNTKGHETTHGIGSLGNLTMFIELEEGFTQLYNPTRSKGKEAVQVGYTINETFAIIIEQIYGPDFMRECFFGSEDLYTKLIKRFYPNQEYINLLKDINADIATLRKSIGSIDNIKDNPNALGIVNGMMKDLKKAYTGLTGKKWEDNKALKLCEARLRGETNLTSGLEITDIAIGDGGEGYVSHLKGDELTIKLSDRIDDDKSWKLEEQFTPVKEIDI